MDEANRRLAGILAADVVGYSAMVGKDEPRTLARVRTLRTDLIEPVATTYGGRLFKTTGDGFLIAFASAVQALHCAITIQVRLGAEPDGLRLRIGVHQGEVVAEGDDLLGDGVIIAARLEPLAEPGGICISARVREDAAGKMALEVDDLGTPELKNIAARVQVFRVRLGQPKRPALPLPDKPSIAVLPFANMSGDPEQEYFADGMTEDITTALSHIRWLFVIARNSAFAYKGTSPDIRKVGRELGVRYVLEGSVRKSGNRVRITVQLIEAASGSHIWADRFDGNLDDVFDLQDRVTARVAAVISPTLRNAEIQRAQRQPTNHPQAYDLLLRALSHYRNWTREGHEEAVRLLRQAITIDPGYALGYAHLSAILWMMVSQGWVDRADPSVADMLDLARTALMLDGEDPEVLVIVGVRTALSGGDLSGGIAMVNKAIALNPNSAVALMAAGNLYARGGDPARALASLDQAERLDPFDAGPSGYSAHIIAHFLAGAYEAAVEWSDKALRDRPRSAAALRYRAASLGLLGRLEEARQTVQRLRELMPDFTIARARRHIEVDMNNVFGKPADREAFYEGLRRAGVPE
jgi:adenylate cyclase